MQVLLAWGGVTACHAHPGSKAGHPLRHVLLQEAGSGRKLVVAKDLVATLAEKLGAELTPLCPSFPG